MLHSVFIEADKRGDYITTVSLHDGGTCALCLEGLCRPVFVQPVTLSFNKNHFCIFLNKNEMDSAKTVSQCRCIKIIPVALHAKVRDLSVNNPYLILTRWESQ